jgi:hypothetical protein
LIEQVSVTDAGVERVTPWTFLPSDERKVQHMEASHAGMDATLPRQAQTAFIRFMRLANKVFLHPLDWDRFYEFVRVCHDHHVQFFEDDVTRLLLATGFSTVQARRIAQVYQHRRAVLARG